MATHTPRPLTVSTILATFVALVALVIVANAPAQLVAVVIAVVGLTALGVGLELWHRGRRVIGGVLVTVGVIGMLAALGWVIGGVRGITLRLELLPGLLGIAVLVAGLAGILRGYERWFLNAGTGLLLVSIVLSGYLHGASVAGLLAATAATVVAWDLGEQAINLGEHVGRQARSWPVELAHGCGAVLVGGLGVVLAISVFGVGVSGVPLIGLTTLLGAVVVLTTSLYI